MKNRRKKYGLGYERKEKKYWIEERQYSCFRNRGSFGLFDMIAVNMNFWILIQVKSTKLDKYSYKKEFEEIKDFGKYQVPQGTVKMLVLYHKGKRKVLYEEVVR